MGSPAVVAARTEASFNHMHKYIKKPLTQLNTIWVEKPIFSFCHMTIEDVCIPRIPILTINTYQEILGQSLKHFELDL
jgi:hypothetical protein